MFVATSLCIVLLAKYGASSDIWQSQLEFNKMGDGIMYPRSEVNNRNAIGISSDDYSAKARRKRTLFVINQAAQLGIRAVKLLLRGATETKYKSKYFTKFVKSGGYKKAKRDFFSVYPSGVTDFKDINGIQSKIGAVGDRSIILRAGGKMKEPTLEIIKTKNINRMTVPSANPQHVADIITYID